MFVFPKPATEPNISSTDAADVAELLVSLSIFGFSQLSADDQHEKTKNIYDKVVEEVVVQQIPEESEDDFRLRTFTELFKKLPFPHQNHFLSTVIKKFKRERQIDKLISWFSTQLDANDQNQLIEEIVHVKPDAETNEDFRLKRFTQLCQDYTDYVVTCREEYVKKPKHTQQTSDTHEVCSDSQSRFADFFLGFSIIWFKGQSSNDQGQLIDQLCDGVEGVMVEKIADESEADFRLRRFTELCKKVADFGVQVHFLDKAEQKLLHKRRYLPHGVLLQPQDSASAAELLSQLSSFWFSLLSPNDQQDNIELISSKLAAGDVNVERLAGETVDDLRRKTLETVEDLRRKTFSKLFNKAPVGTRINLFREFKSKFVSERRLCESILLFRQLDSNEQQETIEEMFDRSGKVTSKDVKDVILEKLPEECEENFRLRRFIKLCSTHPFLLDRFFQNEAKKWDLKSLHMQKTSGKEEIEEIKQSRFAEFYLGLSIIWFKARCASDSRNPIQVLLGKVGEGDCIIEKLVNETEEDFRLRRFTESFKQLRFSSQEDIVKYILEPIFHDLGHQELKKEEKKDGIRFCGRPPFARRRFCGSGGAATQGDGEGILHGVQGTRHFTSTMI